jgi:putative tricarboxylic transport membrane protein
MVGRDSRDLSAAACLLGIAAVATWQGSGLELGTLRQMGPGMLPRVLAVLVGACGGAIGVRSLLAPQQKPAPASGAARGIWPALRAPVYLMLAATAFGLSVRPLGLVIAAPLAIFVSTLASPETRRLESLWFAFGMTAFCVVLFRRMLGLSIPVAPWLIGY